MPQLGLTDRDVRGMLAIARPYTADDGPLVPWALLDDLRALIPCDALQASWQDTPAWEIVDQDVGETEDLSTRMSRPR